MNYREKFIQWDIANFDGEIKFILRFRSGIVYKSSHPKNFMEGWDEVSVENWLRRMNYQVLVESTGNI